MKRIAVITAVLCSLLVVSTADATYYISKRRAESLTRQHLHYDMGYLHTAAYCRPQGLDKAEPGYIYHRWVCGWVAGSDSWDIDCKGAYKVVGHRGHGNVTYNVLTKRGSCPYG